MDKSDPGFPSLENASGQTRTIVRDIYPDIEGGRFAIKRVVGELVDVWANVLSDGHDIVCAALQYRHKSQADWSEIRAKAIGNDRWHASFKVEHQGTYYYRFIGWIDQPLYWQYGLRKKADAGLDVSVELLEGLELLTYLSRNADSSEIDFLTECLAVFRDDQQTEKAIQLGKSENLQQLFEKYPNRPFIASSQHEYRVYVDREKAAFSTWYEFFPRSSSTEPGAHGTFKDCIDILPRIAELGFDTLYFPPIHPIGRINRKGRNNSNVAEADDVGSCWGIGAEEGGHKDVHPDLGSMDDFEKLIKAANDLGIEVAMDYALQAAPDHPWVKEHPSWFRQRPDGSIQYAENPPKKYQDIYPIYFETEDWKEMWEGFLDVLEFWIEKGISVFRVDNPHTKPFGFWEWIIAAVKEKHPDVLFLAEAFSRPEVMHELGRAGFTQSYTYYTWRNSKQELEEYVKELTAGPVSETFRPNFWPNTPDILPFPLQNASESTYLVRYFLAATLSSNCGVYGPVYEFMVNRAVAGKEEYLDSEKYQVCNWNWNERNAITDLYKSVNTARREYKALQRTNNIEFLHIEHDQLIAYIKHGSDGSSVICVASLDPANTAAGKLHLHPDQVGCGDHGEIKLKDHMTGGTFTWQGGVHHIELHPKRPYHLLIVE